LVCAVSAIILFGIEYTYLRRQEALGRNSHDEMRFRTNGLEL